MQSKNKKNLQCDRYFGFPGTIVLARQGGPQIMKCSYTHSV